MNEQQRQAAARELYDRLRSIARSRMAGQRAGHTLDPTGLANEAVLRLLGCDAASIRDEEHFLAVAAEAMRQILVDHARGKATAKRGGKIDRTADPNAVGAEWARADPGEILAAHEALAALEAEDADAAELVKLRVFAGIPAEEIAALRNVSRRTVERRLRFAIARMRRSAGSAGDGSGEQWEPEA